MEWCEAVERSETGRQASHGTTVGVWTAPKMNSN